MINATPKMAMEEHIYCSEQGMPPATVIFLKPIFEEGYLESGMKARLVGARQDYASVDSDYHTEPMWILEFEFSEFQDFNVKREAANYWDDHGNATLTATESGNYPKNHREEFYVELSDDTYYFTILDDSDLRTVYFDSKEEMDMAVRGLMDLDALFEMRVNEAETAKDPEHVEIARKEREVVAKALKALGVDI